MQRAAAMPLQATNLACDWRTNHEASAAWPIRSWCQGAPLQGRCQAEVYPANVIGNTHRLHRVVRSSRLLRQCRTGRFGRP